MSDPSGGWCGAAARCLIAVAIMLMAACSEGESCERAAKASADHFVRANGTANVKTMIDVVAPELEATIRSRCREDRWSAKAIGCIARNDLGCWSDELTEAQRASFERSVREVLAKLEAAAR
jgi:hypothetical protein